MADDPNSQPEDLEGILSDLHEILSGISETPITPPAVAASGAPAPKAPEPAKPPPPAPKPVEASKPAEPPKPVEPPKPAEPPKPPPPPPAPPPAAPPTSADLKLELTPRPNLASVPAKAPEPPKPAEPPKPVEPPKAVVPPKPAEPPKAPEAAKPDAAPAASVPDEIPAGTPKDQIRRIAYVYTFSCAEARAGFATYLSQAARTISKKPLFLRQVMVAELTASSDPFAVFEKARDAKAVAVLAVVEGWPPAKVEGLSEACSRGGLLFRAVAPADVQKKSTAVDVIVDMMLLPGEA